VRVSGHLVDQRPGEFAAGLQATQQVKDHGREPLDVCELRHQRHRRPVGQRPGLLGAHDRQHVLVAGAAQPILRSEVMHNQAGRHSRVSGDRSKPDAEPVPTEPVNGGIADPRRSRGIAAVPTRLAFGRCHEDRLNTRSIRA
jgi:hypothetical protein